MQLGWLCKHSGSMGMVTLPEEATGLTMGELATLINESHSQKCKIGGQIWITMDTERCGTVARNGSAIESRIENPSEGQLFICLHIQ